MSDRLRPPSVLYLSASENVCTDTVAGWLWYCDEHDTHGNADSQGEAEYLGTCHEAWVLGQGDEGCELFVWRRSRHERVSR